MSHFGVSLSRNSYFMDLENDMLRGKWHRPIPKGVERDDYTDWTDLIHKHLDVCAGLTFVRRCETKLAEHLASGSNDICVIYDEDKARGDKMSKYIAWIKAGGGDEWFVEE